MEIDHSHVWICMEIHIFFYKKNPNDFFVAIIKSKAKIEYWSSFFSRNWKKSYFSEKPASPSLLERLERKESLNELWTLELPDNESRLEAALRRLLDETGLVGASLAQLTEVDGPPLPDAGAWTSTLKLQLAVTVIACPGFGVEHRDELTLFVRP